VTVASAAVAAPEVELHGSVDLRLLASDSDHVWLDEGLEKQRFAAGDEPVQLGAALADLRVGLTSALDLRATAAIYDDSGAAIDPIEAYFELHPEPRSAWRWRLKGGAFYPPVSLANTDLGWTSPYTLSFSAIDTWIGEEVRGLGIEVEMTHLGSPTGSAHDVGLVGSAFRSNDPAGALLSWRGWSLGDRQTGWLERLPLADLPAFRPTGSFPPQEAYEEPFVELDDRVGFYVGAQWDVLERSRVRLLHYDNRGDPAVIGGGQWAWHTEFDHIGWRLRPRAGTEIIVQALSGDTEMDGFTGPLVYVEFQAASVLLSGVHGAHRASLRVDLFSVTDEDTTLDDPNAEHGRAWTVAYFYAPEGRLQPRYGSWRFGLELLRIDSDRSARRLFGEPARRSENSLQASFAWRF